MFMHRMQTLSNYAQDSNAYQHQDSLESCNGENLDSPDGRSKASRRSSVNVTTYHKRRQQTGYLVGFEDLEEKLRNDITQNFELIQGNTDGLMQLVKDFDDYKRSLEDSKEQNNQKFEMEVKSCLTEMMEFITEI